MSDVVDWVEFSRPQKRSSRNDGDEIDLTSGVARSERKEIYRIQRELSHAWLIEYKSLVLGDKTLAALKQISPDRDDESAQEISHDKNALTAEGVEVARLFGVGLIITSVGLAFGVISSFFRSDWLSAFSAFVLALGITISATAILSARAKAPGLFR